MMMLMMMLVMMLMMVVMAAAIRIVAFFVVMMMVMGMFLQMRQFLCQGLGAFNGFLHLNTGQLIPGGSDHRCRSVMLANQCHNILDLFVTQFVCAAEYDAGCRVDLIFIEFTKAGQINITAGGIDYSRKGAQLNIVRLYPLNSSHNVTEFANAGGFDQDTFRRKVSNDLGQRTAKITHQRAANAAGIHFSNLNAGFLQETAVNTDIAKFIFNQNEFFALISFFDQFLNQGRFTRTQETGKNINSCHDLHTFYHRVQTIV